MIDTSKFKKIKVEDKNTRVRSDKPMLVLYHNYLYLSKSFVRLVRDYKYVVVYAVANCVQLEFSKEKLEDSLELNIQSHVNKNNVIEYGKIGGVELCKKLSDILNLFISKDCYYKTTDYECKGNIFQFKFDRNSPFYRKSRKN